MGEVIWFDKDCYGKVIYRKPILLRIRTEEEYHTVTASSVEAFLRRWMKPQRLDNGYVPVAQKVATYTKELDAHGYCFLTRHESMTGNEVYYVPSLLAESTD